MVSFFDFIEEENTLPMLGENLSQTSACARLITHEEFHGIGMKEFGHVEAEKRSIAKQTARELSHQFSFANTSRPEDPVRPVILMLISSPRSEAFFDQSSN